MSESGVVVVHQDRDLLPRLSMQEIDNGRGRGIRGLKPEPAGNVWPCLATLITHVGKGQHGPIFELMHDIVDTIMVEPGHEAGGNVQLRNVPAPDLSVEILSQDDLRCFLVPSCDDVHLLVHTNIPGAAERLYIHKLKMRVAHLNMAGWLVRTTGINVDSILLCAQSQAANKDIGQALARTDHVDGIARTPFAVNTITPESQDAGNVHVQNNFGRAKGADVRLPANMDAVSPADVKAALCDIRCRHV